MKGGFTLVEVSLFLAITGLLFLGVTIGVQNSIFQQRYNDSVQNFVEFLRSAYSKTENVQGTNDGGNTKKAIYGKLITFGENNSDDIFMYDVIGNAKCEGSFDGTIGALKDCKAEVIEGGNLIGQAESYNPRWSAAIQDVKGDLYKGAILITRHPQSGTIYTFVMNNNTVEVSQKKGLNSLLDSFSIGTGPINFCVNPNGNTKDSGTRANVRIEQGARNSSGVEIAPDNENECVERK